MNKKILLSFFVCMATILFCGCSISKNERNFSKLDYINDRGYCPLIFHYATEQLLNLKKDYSDMDDTLEKDSKVYLDKIEK